MDSAPLCSDMQPGDSKWSITIWARNAETGMAKWVYPIEPHDGPAPLSMLPIHTLRSGVRAGMATNPTIYRR
jgi:hypothetical protein